MAENDGISDAEIRAELETILSSQSFIQSQSSSAFLRYIVTESLEGRADRLKGYTIAVEALGRPDSFDPANNPLVRVQAKRLRDLLDRYYLEEGRETNLRIALPVGSYAPDFQRREAEDTASGLAPAPPGDGAIREAAVPAVPPVEPAAPLPGHSGIAGFQGGSGESRSGKRPRRKALWLVPGLAAVLALAAIGATYHFGLFSSPLASHKQRLALIAGDRKDVRGRDASQVLPLIEFSITAEEKMPAWFSSERYLERLQSFAVRFDETVVVRSQPSYSAGQPGQPHYQLDYRLFYREGRVLATVMVTDTRDERLVASLSFTILPGNAGSYLPDVYRKTPEDLRALRSVIQPSGILFTDIGKLTGISAPLACLQSAYRYYNDSTAQNHLNARSCLEDTIRENPRLSQAYSMLGAMYMSEYRQNLNPLPGDPMERAEAALRKAILLSPLSSTAYQNLESFHIIRGSMGPAIEAGKRALALNPDDIEAIGNFGSLLARVGRYQEALAYLDRAIGEYSVPPQWAHYYAFLARNNLGRTGEADVHARQFLGTRSSLYLTAVILSAWHQGDDNARKRAIETLLEVEPDLKESPYQPFRRRGLTDPVITRLLQDLQAAGVGVNPDVLKS